MHVAYGEHIARAIQRARWRSVLSLGIGHTEVARRIVEQLTAGPLRRYVIVDGAPKLIEAFRLSLEPVPAGLEIMKGFFETFECAGPFDAIEAGFVLEHVADPALILHRLRRFLAPSGRLFIAVPNARSLHRLLGHHAGMLADMYMLSDADLALGHKRYFDAPSLADLVTRCGYRVEKMGGMLLKPFTTGQMQKLDLPPAVWQALMTVSDGYPEIANAIYLEATV